MSAGNLDTPNGKKNNFSYQFNVLRMLGMISGTSAGAEAILTDIESNTDGIESILTQILGAIQLGADYEANFVIDGDGTKWLEVRVYNPDTQTWNAPQYFAPGSTTPLIPVAPLTYEIIDTAGVPVPVAVSSVPVTVWDAAVDFTSDTIPFIFTEPWSLSVTDYAIVGGAPKITILCSIDDSTYNTYKTSATLVDISNTANRVFFDDMFMFKFMKIQYVSNGATGTFGLTINK